MISKISDIVTSYIPGSQLVSALGGELIYKLSDETSKYANMLDNLSLKKEELGIMHIGLTLTTLEQVFLK